jgi:hypothetical protein
MDKLSEELFIKNRVLYRNLASSYFKPEHKEWKMFISSISKFAVSVDEGFCDLYRAKNYVCMVHLIRMMCDACFEAYRLLITDEKEKYLRYFFSDRDTNRCKLNGVQITTSVLKEKIEEEYSGMAQVYKFSNRFIHPTSFYFRDYDLEDNREIEHDDDVVLPDYGSLYLKEEVERMTNIMGILNEVLLEILRKLKDQIEPPIVLPQKLNLQTMQWEDNPEYKKATNSDDVQDS